MTAPLDELVERAQQWAAARVIISDAESTGDVGVGTWADSDDDAVFIVHELLNITT